MIDLPTHKYPESQMTYITKDKPETQHHAVSSLGLFGLRTAFELGQYDIRMTDMEKVFAEGQQHTPFASHVESNYHFSRHSQFNNHYSRIGGKSIRYGKIIEELDAMAGDVSYKYLLQNLHPDNFNPETRPYFLVTVSVDRVDFMHKLDAEKDLRLSAFMLMA